MVPVVLRHGDIHFRIVHHPLQVIGQLRLARPVVIAAITQVGRAALSDAARTGIGAHDVSAEGQIPVRAVDLLAFLDVPVHPVSVKHLTRPEIEVNPVVGHSRGVTALAGQCLAVERLYVVIVHAGTHQQAAQQEAHCFQSCLSHFFFLKELITSSIMNSSCTHPRAPAVAGTLNIVMPEPRVFGT